MHYPAMHQTLTVGPLTLKNRLVMPPMATEKSAGGTVSDELCEYYDLMTQGGSLALVVTEHFFVSPEGKASPNQVSIADDSCIDGLARLVSVLHKNGALAMAQISHAGSVAKESITGLPVFGPSAVQNPGVIANRSGPACIPNELDQANINRLISCYADAAERAKKAGYDGIEVHSAHGYFLNQFYSPLTNKRTDAYSGSTIEGRTHLHREICQAIRDRVGQSMAISLRFGACDYREGGSRIDEIPAAAQRFAEAGIDMISISGGMCAYNSPNNIKQAWFAELAKAVKTTLSLPVLLTGGISEPETAEELLKTQQADLIGVGRALLKNKNLANQWINA